MENYQNYSEADTIHKLIKPNIYKCGWTEDNLRYEENAGANIINPDTGKVEKDHKRIDITLRVKVAPKTQPVAVALIEAKSAKYPPTRGLEQAKLYAGAKRLNVPFVYATNGFLFVEYDSISGLTSQPRPMTEFPTPDDLRKRYEEYMGFNLEDERAKPLLEPYVGGDISRRYYQDAAIRAALEKIAAGGTRVLLTLATGSGKTRIAVNLLKRIADAGQLRRALFLCDRDELRKQSTGAFQEIFGNDAAPVSGNEAQKNARILIATYQTLDIDTDDADANFLTTNYPPNFFSHIVIDEAHRSAWGKWSQVLRMNPDAIQIGLTATPRQLKVDANTPEVRADEQISADNVTYFGEPVYEYDIGQGIEDGYLAACEIRKSTVNLDETGITIADILARNPIDAMTGELITEAKLREIYQKHNYEDEILLPDRVLAMAQDLFQHLLATGGPHQKTIIFCVRDSHADAVTAVMNNLYAEWCKTNGKKRAAPYAFKCTSANQGRDYLADLRGSNRTHFIAATVDLLSTGVDVPSVRNIAFFRYVRSPISFYQMIGRGTRLHTPTEKLMFRVYDYTDATDNFGKDFITKVAPQSNLPDGDTEREQREREPIIQVEGFEVHVTLAGRYIVADIDGQARPLTIEEYREYVASNLLHEVDTLEAFRALWVNPVARGELLTKLPSAGRSVLLLQKLTQMDAYDLYDVLGELGYGLTPRTRTERAEAFNYKHVDWLNKLPLAAATTIRAIAAQFAFDGTDGLENPLIFRAPEVASAGGLDALKTVGKPAEVLRETKERMFAA
jgi:type I restriction enzyme R subunit